MKRRIPLLINFGNQGPTFNISITYGDSTAGKNVLLGAKEKGAFLIRLFS
jgi:hypothetical protein